MSMNDTPVANRFTIGLFGRRNVGKSSLLNAITSQQIAVTSEVAGTTTDPVTKTMEILPIGPVQLIDTAGLDDEGELGKLRIEKTYQALRKCNLAVLVTDCQSGITEFEKEFLKELQSRKINGICVFNKCDDMVENAKLMESCPIPSVCASSLKAFNINKVKKLIIDNSDTEIEPSLVEGIVNAGDIVVLVTPIDSAAPKGRFILPQQQVLRAVLDIGAVGVVTKETELEMTLKSFKQPPAIVITDSQAFAFVSEVVPESIPLTSFSLLFARQKGDLDELVKGAELIKTLKPGDKVLIAEGCTHHRQKDDIGTVKIPRFLKKIAGGDMDISWCSGGHFPDNLDEFKVIIHCGACMLNRKEMLFRIKTAKDKNIAITNYGVFLALATGITERALKPLQL